MSRVVILPFALLGLLAGCTSPGNPYVRGDFHETAYMASRALQGDEAAFDRLAVLKKKWDDRAEHGFLYSAAPWDRANRDRAGEIAADVDRVVGARDAILAQRESTDVMVNALKDLESEYDDMMDLLAQGEDATAADMKLAADQKYIARRLANSLVLMAQDDMTASVEAADTFGRDVTRFQHLLDVAINGDEEAGIEPNASGEVQESLSQIEELFSGYVAESSDDLLENVVLRYDAWDAVADLARLADEALPKKATPASPPAEPAAAGQDQAAADEGAADEGATDEAAPEDANPDEAGADQPEAEDSPDAMDPAGEDVPAEEPADTTGTGARP